MSQARVVYSCYPPSPDEHPQAVMKKLSTELGFEILGSVPQSMGDCWWFWVSYEATPAWPPYITEDEWLPVGTV